MGRAGRFGRSDENGLARLPLRLEDWRRFLTQPALDAVLDPKQLPAITAATAPLPGVRARNRSTSGTMVR